MAPAFCTLQCLGLRASARTLPLIALLVAVCFTVFAMAPKKRPPPAQPLKPQGKGDKKPDPAAGKDVYEPEKIVAKRTRTSRNRRRTPLSSTCCSLTSTRSEHVWTRSRHLLASDALVSSWCCLFGIWSRRVRIVFGIVLSRCTHVCTRRLVGYA